jgi:hypothetical protein
MVAVHGTNVTLLVDNTTIFSHTFAPRLVDGRSVGLNEGMVGVGSLSARGLFDNVRVQKVPPAITLQWTDDFGDGSAERFTGSTTGAWQVLDGRYQGAPATGAERATTLIDLGLPKGLAPTSILELEATLRTQGTGGFVFDQYGPDDFKFVGIDTATDRVAIGHHTARGGWVTDAFATRALDPGRDYRLSVSLRGTSVSVSLDGQVVAGHVYNGVVVDGGFGLLARDGASSFDSVMMRTDDRAFAPAAAGSSSASALSSPSSGILSASLVYDDGAATDLSAADGAAGSDAVTLPDYLVHDWVVESRKNGHGAVQGVSSAHSPTYDFGMLPDRRNDRSDDQDPVTVALGGDWLMVEAREETGDLLS